LNTPEPGAQVTPQHQLGNMWNGKKKNGNAQKLNPGTNQVNPLSKLYYFSRESPPRQGKRTFFNLKSDLLTFYTEKTQPEKTSNSARENIWKTRYQKELKQSFPWERACVYIVAYKEIKTRWENVNKLYRNYP